jgi:AcrR family transcriptional regulator
MAGVNQRTRLTTRLFHESLLSLLKEKSIDKITVKELCQGAELNRTTFYLHYGKPADVLAEIEDELICKTQSCLMELKEENAVARMQALLEYIRGRPGDVSGRDVRSRHRRISSPLLPEHFSRTE